MSYDFYIGVPNKICQIKEVDLRTKLGDDFTIIDVQNDDTGWVSQFTISEGNTSEWEFVRQEDGYFWTDCTMHGAWAEELSIVCQKVAVKFDWQVTDPQM